MIAVSRLCEALNQFIWKMIHYFETFELWRVGDIGWPTACKLTLLERPKKWDFFKGTLHFYNGVGSGYVCICSKSLYLGQDGGRVLTVFVIFTVSLFVEDWTVVKLVYIIYVISAYTCHIQEGSCISIPLNVAAFMERRPKF